MKILELFSGYGTASFALKRLGIPYECVGYSDIDKYANQCFRQNHCKNGSNKLELGDIKAISAEKLQDFDLLTGGFPCQAFSNAGKMQGELDPRGTLFYEIIRIAEVKKPRYMLLENVKGLTNNKFKDTFNKILSELSRIGYSVTWRVLNSKDYGIPQSRARVWFVCFRNYEDCLNFKWPEPKELKIFVRDVLEKEVDEKYYLNDNFAKRLLESSDVMKKFSALNPEIAITETARQYANWKGNFVSSFRTRNLITGDVSPTLQSTMSHGNTVPLIIPAAQRQKDRHGKEEEKIQQLEIREDGCTNTLTSVQKDNLIVLGNLESDGWEKRFEEIRRVYSPEGLSPTIPTSQGGGVTPKFLVDFRIRRLTPKECFRLMGFLNDEINFNYTEKRWFYKDKGNIKLWKTQSAKSSAVTEKPTHTNMEITVSCTTRELEKLELGKNKEEILRKIENVCIVIERLEKVDAKECVINITKCSDYTGMLYTLIKRKIELNEMDMFVELEEGRGIKSLWKISLEENLSEEKSFITSILINWIIQKKIYSYVKTESTIIANIMNYNLLPQNFLNLELSSLRMDTTKKLSDTALYKLAGNGQDVNMVSLIFKEMFK